jgi:hypothetical protein
MGNVNYATLDDEPIGTLSPLGLYCWECKQEVKEVCPKCKKSDAKIPLTPYDIPAPTVHQSNKFTWLKDPASFMTGRRWYLMENGRVISIHYFRGLINNTCAIQVLPDNSLYHSETIQRNTRKEWKAPAEDKGKTKNDSIFE